MTLKSFIPGESIKASDTNSNNQFILKQIEDDCEDLNHKIEAIKSTISSQIVSMIGNLYPVGAIYIGTTANCPLSSIVGTWEFVSSGRVLQGADGTHPAGTTIEAGLPNVWGSLPTICNQSVSFGRGRATISGGFTGAFIGSMQGSGSGTMDLFNVDINASVCSPIYGRTNTVQPPAYVVNVWRRVA